ncbi:MAG: cytochrome c [Myxococcota bacterium]
MRQLSSFSKAAILVAVCYVGLAYGVQPPLPATIVYLYMGLVLIGILSQIGIEDEKLREFARPILELLVAEDKARHRIVAFTLLPLAVAYITFSSTSVSSDPPAELRTVHPAPPATMQFRGREIELAALENPLRHDVENFDRHVEAGRATYYQNCHFCHGDDLDGNGMFAHAFNPPPADFTDLGTIAMLQESFVFWRVSKGGPGLPAISAPWSSAMPAWEDMLTEEEIWQVILFMYEATGQVPRTWE